MTVIRRQVIVADVEGRKFRGAQVTSVQANTLTCAVVLEPNWTGTRDCARSLAPQAILGDPICLELAGDSYAVVAAYPTRFAEATGRNESVAEGRICFGLVPDSLSGQQPETPWWSGMLHERSAPWR